jgi:hypothetical protein
MIEYAGQDIRALLEENYSDNSIDGEKECNSFRVSKMMKRFHYLFDLLFCYLNGLDE